jgi:uncharacterized protein YPO0396
MLLGAGAEVNKQDKAGETPLSLLAVGQGKDEVAEILREAIMREIASALAGAFQSRLGADSPAALLSQHLMADIARAAV